MRKVSLNFGVIHFDVSYYGAGNDLTGCENDAKFSQKIAMENGFETHLFLSKDATYKNYIEQMKKMASELVSGDIFMFYGSFHGTFKEYYDGNTEKRYTALCLHDQIVWDQETKELLKLFKQGVKVIWITDCCHSRDNFKGGVFMPLEGMKSHAKFFNFDDIKKETLDVEKFEDININEIKCSIIAFSSSTEYQVSYDLKSMLDKKKPMGLFTASMEKVLSNDLNKELNYLELFKKVLDEVKKSKYPQTPKIQVVNGQKDRILYKRFLS